MDQKSLERADDPTQWIRHDGNEFATSPGLGVVARTHAGPQEKPQHPGVPLRRGDVGALRCMRGEASENAQPFIFQIFLLLSHLISQVTKIRPEYDHGVGPVLQYRGCGKEQYDDKIVPKALLVKPFIKSLVNRLRRQKVLSVTDVRNLLNCLLQAYRYLLEQQFTRHGLKLSNLFLEKSMQLIGDFGLATGLAYAGQPMQAFCGAPNYIPPEVFGQLRFTGPNFEVDVWAISCLFFTLLVGHPPFEGSTLREAYGRMRKNACRVPPGVSSPSSNLVLRLRHGDPQRSSSLEAILQEFFTYVPLPPRLPTPCLTTQTHIDIRNASSTANPQGQRQLTSIAQSKPNEAMVLPGGAQSPPKTAARKTRIIELQRLLKDLCDPRPGELEMENIEPEEDPTLMPVVWITKWIDYTNKYGAGYQLCDNSIGVLFNDSSRVALDTETGNMMHVDKNGRKIYCSLKKYPHSMKKKIILVKYFSNYMDERLQAAAGHPHPRKFDIDGQPYVEKWISTCLTTAFYFSDGTFQINFIDHTKVIICPSMGVVSYIDKDSIFHTYRLQALRCGRPSGFFGRLKCARRTLDKLDSSSA